MPEQTQTVVWGAVALVALVAPWARNYNQSRHEKVVAARVRRHSR